MMRCGSNTSSSWSMLATALVVILALPSAYCEFTNPSMVKDDLSESWTTGDILPIAWSAGWFGGVSKQPEWVDLWVTQFRGDGFKQKLTSNISMSTSGKYNWTIDVSNEQIAGTATYVLRFMNHTDSEVFPTTAPMLPSKGFVLLQKKEVSSSSSTPTPTPTPSPTTAASSSSSSSFTSASDGSSISTSNLASSSPISSGLADVPKEKSNIGGIVGGVLGGLIGIALILVGVLFLLRELRHKKEKEGLASELEGSYTTMPETKDGVSVQYRYELPTQPQEMYTAGNHMHANEMDAAPAVRDAVGMGQVKGTK